MVKPCCKGCKLVSKRLIVFSRYPEPGQTKTRLIPVLGADGAAKLQAQMTEHTLAQVRKLQYQVTQTLQADPLELEIRFVGGDTILMSQWLGTDLAYQLQSEGDLGDRMATAFETAFAQGSTAVVLIGTDCPELSAEDLWQAFTALEQQELVLGPAVDGGYYLIGLRHVVPELFQEIAWGTDQVLRQTLEKAEQQQLSVATLRLLADVDRPQDLEIWLRVKQQKQQSLSLSVIIPALNESRVIGETLTVLQDRGGDQLAEIIVVDAFSLDGTAAIARQYGATVYSAALGRAYQMNEGAGQATGDILLFLHADTQVPPNFITHIQETLAKPGVVAGAFRLGIAGKRWGLRLVEWGTNLRSQLLQLPYGDQGFFLRRSTFNAIGGFADLPIMEDFEILRRLRRRGFIALAPAAVTTSGRRWQQRGICYTTLLNQLIIIGYLLGVPPQRLAQWYR
jgi:rSAM/selenodomain-associated transferase 2/rSAM/selenodomain-associated transferase 1